MSYVMPPNNNIKVLCSQDQPVELQRSVFLLGVAFELADYTNTPAGGGPVRGWGRRSYGGRR